MRAVGDDSTMTDNMHQDPADEHARVPASRLGRRRFLQGVGAVVGAGAVAGTLPAGAAEAVAPRGASRFVALDRAVRAVDTRPANADDHEFRWLSSNRIRLKIGGNFGVPATATAVVATLAGVNRDEPNWIAAFPSGDGAPPLSANLNLRNPNEVNANLVTVKLSQPGGELDVASRVPCDFVLDVIGYYERVGGARRAGRFVGLPSALRALDTRPNHVPDGSFTMVDVTDLGIPADASSVVINLTATETTQSGWYSAVPMTLRSKPTTSSLNVQGAASTRGASAIVPLTNVDGRLRFKIYSLHAAKLVVDVTGYYTSEDSAMSSDGLFVPLVPQRILDTRLPGEIGRLWPGWVVEAAVPGAAASSAAVVCNVTGVDSRGPGHFRVSGARLPVPGTANVNWSSAGAYVPNHAISRITQHGIQIFSSHGAHAVVDLFGYFTGRPARSTEGPYRNPPPPAASPAWILRVPRIGLVSTVFEGDSGPVTDAGHSWHWTGTGYMGQAANVATFAHRTEAGGPYRNLDAMQVGDLFTVTTGDRREYTYRMVRRDLTDGRPENILNAVRAHPGTTFSLVACTVGYDRSKSAYPDIWAPTSLLFRIVVTGELVGWREF
jgi:sortase (surface protein transpeptidase)